MIYSLTEDGDAVQPAYRPTLHEDSYDEVRQEMQTLATIPATESSKLINISSGEDCFATLYPQAVADAGIIFFQWINDEHTNAASA